MCIYIYSKCRKKSWLGRGILTQKHQITIFQVKKGVLVLAILYPISYIKSHQGGCICTHCNLKIPPPILVKCLGLKRLLQFSGPWEVRSSTGDATTTVLIMVFLFVRVPKGVPAFCYNKVIRITSSHFHTVVPTATLLLKAVKGSQSIRRRIKYNLWTTSPLHSYVIAHSVCDLKHANLTLSLPPQSHNHSSSNYPISCTAYTIKIFSVDYILQKTTTHHQIENHPKKILYLWKYYSNNCDHNFWNRNLGHIYADAE